MLVCESMDACISICTIAKSFIHILSRLIPSVEFSPTNSPEDKGKLFIDSNPLEKVHIVYMSVTKLSLAERDSYFSISSVLWMEMLLLSVAIGTSSCARERIDPPVSCGEGMKDEYRAESCDPSPEH
jgi:hypothetical protein